MSKAPGPVNLLLFIAKERFFQVDPMQSQKSLKMWQMGLEWSGMKRTWPALATFEDRMGARSWKSKWLPLRDNRRGCCLVAKSCQILLQHHRLLCSWDFPGKNTGVGCRFLLQGIFLTRVSCIAGRFFITEPPGKPDRNECSLQMPSLILGPWDSDHTSDPQDYNKTHLSCLNS